jgi:hypothetical protein
MRPFISTLLLSTVVACVSTPGAAKEIKTLKPLLGYYGKDAEACRSYHRKGGLDLARFNIFEGKYYFSECEAKQCSAEILSSRATGSVHVIKLKFTGTDGSSTETIVVKPIAKNIIQVSGPDRGRKTFIRCTEKDAIAGIGLALPTEPVDVDFTPNYARAVPTLCPHLEPGPELASKIDIPPPEQSPAARWYTFSKWMATRSAELDKEEVANYCAEVMGAFGENGRVAPHFLKQTPRP